MLSSCPRCPLVSAGAALRTRTSAALSCYRRILVHCAVVKPCSTRLAFYVPPANGIYILLHTRTSAALSCYHCSTRHAFLHPAGQRNCVSYYFWPCIVTTCRVEADPTMVSPGVIMPPVPARRRRGLCTHIFVKAALSRFPPGPGARTELGLADLRRLTPRLLMLLAAVV